MLQELGIEQLNCLVVEPSLAQGRLMLRRLEELGVGAAHWERDGAAARAAMERLEPDLVLSAFYLPDMTGTELVRGMREHPALEATPFMLVSSETSFSMLDPIRQAGVVAILPKPFAAADLRRALDATVDHIRGGSDLGPELVPDELEVLVVDDSTMARKHIARVLRGLGLERITEAADGREAAERIEQQFFDLVVTDYNMPEMDGEHLVRHIREHSSQGAIPILMVTSEGDASRLAAVQQAGGSGICDKPFDVGTVRQLLRQMLNEA